MVSNGIKLERIDEELQLELSRPETAEQKKQLVVKVTITRTLTFAELGQPLLPQVCHADAHHMIV